MQGDENAFAVEDTGSVEGKVVECERLGLKGEEGRGDGGEHGLALWRGADPAWSVAVMVISMGRLLSSFTTRANMG